MSDHTREQVEHPPRRRRADRRRRGAHERSVVRTSAPCRRGAAGTVVWVQHSDEGLARGLADRSRAVPRRRAARRENYGDSFEDTTLETVLSGLGVGRLVVVGAQTDECIRSTLHGAFADATLVSDAHTTEDHTAGVRRPRTRSSRTPTCTGPTTRRRADGRDGRDQGRRLRRHVLNPARPAPRRRGKGILHRRVAAGNIGRAPR